LPANFLLFGKISLALNDPPKANHPERRVIERQVLDRAINFRRELGVDVFNLQERHLVRHACFPGDNMPNCFNYCLGEPLDQTAAMGRLDGPPTTSLPNLMV